MAPALPFVNWKEAEQYFKAKEADQDTIEMTHKMLQKDGVAVMTIV